MPRLQPQQRATSGGSGCKEDSERWHDALMTGKMSLKTPISRNTTADVMVAPNTGVKPGVIRVEIEVTEIKIDLTMKKESMTPSARDTNNRGRSLLTTSRSEECSAAQATFNYSNVRIRDQQAATRSDYSDLWGIPVEADVCLELLATDMAPTPHLKCKFSTAHHLTGILHLVLIKIEQVAQPHNHSRLLLLMQEISDWSRAKTVVMREHLDMTETVEFSLAKVTEILKRNVHQIKDLVHDNPPAEAGEITVMMTTTNIGGRMIANPVPSYQLEQRMRTGMQTLTKLNPLYRGHIIHTKQIRVVPPNLMTISCHMTTTLALLNLNLEVTQAVKNSPAKTPCMLNYKATSSLRKKISYCKGELKPACPLKLPLQKDIERCHHLLHPRRANGVMKPTWTGWLLKSRSIVKSRLRNERSGIKHLTSSKL